MKGIFLSKLISLAFIANSAFAWQSGETNIYLGGANLKQGNAQFSGILDALGNIYTRTTKAHDTSFLGGVGYFLTMRSYQNMELDLGGQIYYLSGAQLQGIIYEEFSFPNLSYQYKTQNVPIYAATKLKWNT
ncbi:hypothetical protein [Legionella sp. km772]|uniref:hypothetical protein n=1 Tax=Legionella sp. km772 TaxID=2498111 RepID=UPI000F8E5D72|nr:hypothetical protein [Legionella sp. km772]RUR09987.1 hypothetical protein ELY15_08675 [Legionella sp. km772]